MKLKSRAERKKNLFKAVDLRPMCFHHFIGGCHFVSPEEYTNPPPCDGPCPNWCCFNAEHILTLGVTSKKRPITLHDVMAVLKVNPFGEGQTKMPTEYNPPPPPPTPTPKPFTPAKVIRTQTTTLNQNGSAKTEFKDQATLF